MDILSYIIMMNATAAVATGTGERTANGMQSAQAPMIEHVVIYQFDASTDTELSLEVDDHVWVSVFYIYRVGYGYKTVTLQNCASL